jgi:hypothetical protein
MHLRDGAQPVILIFPEGSDLAHWRGERTKRYAPLLGSRFHPNNEGKLAQRETR